MPRPVEGAPLRRLHLLRTEDVLRKDSDSSTLSCRQGVAAWWRGRPRASPCPRSRGRSENPKEQKRSANRSGKRHWRPRGCRTKPQHFQHPPLPCGSPEPASCKPTFKGVLSKYLSKEALSVGERRGTTAISTRSHMSSVMATPHRTSAVCLSTA